MDIDVIRESIPKYRVPFNLNPVLWEDFDKDVHKILHTIPMWEEKKFLESDGRLHGEMNELPNNFGGIYLFVAKPNLIPNSHFFLMYVGRARYTENHNLRVRCRRYIKAELKRPKIKRMVEDWGQYLFVRYLPLKDNELIARVEEELINKVLPPFNDEIPNKDIRDAVKAFF